LNKETRLLDNNIIEDLAKKENPKVIIAGASAYSREWDYKALRSIADSVGAFLMCDMAHPAGLIAKGLLDNPLPYCDVVTSTTHKTLRGPRGGIILMKEDRENPWGLTPLKGDRIKMMSELFDSTVMPGIQGGPLMHIIMAKAVAFGEVLADSFKTYAEQVIKNAKTLADELIKYDFDVVSGGTDNHLMLIDLTNKEISGKKAEIAIKKAANTNIITIACLRYFFINAGVKIPSFVKKNETIGSSKTNPAASITLIMIDMYSFIANSFFIASVPNSAANFNARGSITKYANAIPARKHRVE